MYKRNYSEVIDFLETKYLLGDNSTNLINVSDLEIVPCHNGWIYDRTTFPNTVVMEVFIFWK